jgi:hypothetical protein
MSNPDKEKICSFCNKTSTDLQCSKTGCENYICPSCLEQTPVGARCPDCAQMKKNPLYDPSNKELVVSAFAGILVSMLSGIVFSLIINIVGKIILPGFILLIIPLGAIGYLTGITIERTSKFKKSTSLQIIAGISVLMGSIIYSNVFLFSIPGLIGLILGVYLALYRVRP